ncbi:hypothetical protein I5168_12045 [Nonlabens sp. SCSIO 43208]|uniref:hypothetical protein n=1 Tax=Nonlabens sp. SCSIO 43208 TaxID=2793009 RepID=UPI003D6BD6A2
MNQPVTFETYKRVCQLATRTGFMKAYYQALPQYDTFKQTFEAINNEYYQHFNEYRYSDYKAFQKAYSKYMRRDK